MDRTSASWEAIKAKTNFTSRRLALQMCVGLSLRVPGNIVEFGVAQGDSTRMIRESLTRLSGADAGRRIFGIDSFMGLPERFADKDVGYFACEPPEIEGVEIIQGYFEDVLTPALAGRIGEVSFAHLDADLSASTTCALNFLTPLLNTGSLLLFDQFMGDGGQERRAFEDWRARTGVQTLKVAEFAREPSGDRTDIDKRVVCQIIGNRSLPHSSQVPEIALSTDAFERTYVTRPDILPLDAPARLTDGWYALEDFGGETFRWVNNGAGIMSRGGAMTLSAELEPGPGAGGDPLDLVIQDSDGAALHRFEIPGRQTIRFSLPATDKGSFRLHVNGGGVRTPGDSRILNFRVFQITTE